MSVQVASLYALVSVAGADSSVRDLQRVSGQVNKTQSLMSGLASHAGQMGKGIGQVGAGLARVGIVAAAAIAAAGVAAVKTGMTFQQQMELIHTQAGARQQEVIDQSKAVQALVAQVGVGPVDLAKGLYHIESVGLRGAKALDVLRASALGAKVGLADMESVTNALTAVVFSGIKGAKSMTDAMAILDGIVGVGNMHLQDLTDSFKSGVLGTAATYGVDIRSLGAAIATLTDAGVPANIAATRLNMTLTHMAAPVPGAIKVLKRLGISQFDLAKDLRKPDGIFVALKDLNDHLEKSGEIKNGILSPQGAADLSKIFGGSRFGATAMQLLTAMNRVEGKYGDILKRSSTFGENVQATLATAGFQWSAFRANLEETGVAFSDGILPALGRMGVKANALLVSHLDDARTAGKRVGDFLESIDWNKVESGAKAFVGFLQTALSIVQKIPPEVDAAVLAFMGVNKVSGGLVGRGVENIAGGAIGMGGDVIGALIRNTLGSKGGLLGSIGGQVGATPVYITGVAPGAMLALGGGGLGGNVAAGAAGAAGGGLLATVLAFVPAILAGVAAYTLATGPLKDTMDTIAGQEKSNKENWAKFLQTGSSEELTNAMKGIREAFADNPTGALDQDHLHTLQTMFDAEMARRAGLGPDERNPVPGAPDKSWDTHSEALHTQQANTEAIAANTKAQRDHIASLYKSAREQLAGIAHRSAEKYGHGGLGPAAVMATFGRNLMRKEQDILNSHRTANAKLEHLRALQAIAVAGKDWGVARKIGTDIKNLKIQPGKVNVEVAGQAIATAVMPWMVDERPGRNA